MQILQLILVIIAFLGLIFSNWLGPLLAKVLIPVVNSPMGAVIVTLALLVLFINFLNWIIGMTRVRRG